ncbi:MAG: FAD-binding monooxygenase [Promethearchaeota archaeon]|nr:MAG: FAD-binding monooxygenase [Candidatus Lokiarchaeota archaeon]
MLLKDAFENMEWYLPELLNSMNQAQDFYFDSVSQIVLDRWYENRVALMGDACQSVSLIAGQGSALAMAGAYILAGELKTHGDNYQKAFETYQNKMLPEIRRKQEMAKDFANSFIPDTKISLWFRNKISKLITKPLFSKFFIKRFMSDSLQLEDY